MRNERIFDVDQIVAAVNKAREYAEKHDAPLNLDRVALYLGLTTTEYGALMIDIERKAKEGDEHAQALDRAFKIAKQETRADLTDRINERKSQPAGPIFLAKVNHQMVETTRQEVEFKGVIFEGEENVPD